MARIVARLPVQPNNHAWVAQLARASPSVTRRSAVRARLQAPVRGRVIGSSPVQLGKQVCAGSNPAHAAPPGVSQRSRPLLTVTITWSAGRLLHFVLVTVKSGRLR